MSRKFTPAQIAAHWGCSKSYVCRKIREGMPDFDSLDQASAWRLANAPSRAAKIAESEVSGTPILLQKTNTFSEKNIAQQAAPPRAVGVGDVVSGIIDIEAFTQPEGDYDVAVVGRAERSERIAHGLYNHAATLNQPAQINYTLATWTAAAKASAEIRTRFLEIQEKKRALISIDEVMDIVGTELQAFRSAFLKLGERIATRANPSDPALARSVIDAEIDRQFSRLATTEQRARHELSAA